MRPFLALALSLAFPLVTVGIDPVAAVQQQLKAINRDPPMTYRTNGGLVLCTAHCRDLEERNALLDTMGAVPNAGITATKDPPTVCIVVPFHPAARQGSQPLNRQVTAKPTVGINRPARYGAKEEICAEVVSNYVASHQFIPDHFVCVEFASGVWYDLLKRGVNAKIRVGSREVGSIHKANHAWVMAEVAPGTWLAIEPQHGIVYPESNSFYYRGYDFSQDFPVREHNKRVKARWEAQQDYHEAAKDRDETAARYAQGDWAARQALLPILNNKRQFADRRLAEVQEAEQRVMELLQRATPSR